MASTTGTVIELVGVAILGYVGYQVVKGVVTQAQGSGQSVAQQFGTDVGRAINTAILDLEQGFEQAAIAILKQVGVTLLPIVGGYLLLRNGVKIGYLVYRGVKWLFSRQPPTGGSGGAGTPLTPVVPTTPVVTPILPMSTLPIAVPTNTQPITPQVQPAQAQGLLSRVESILRSGRRVATVDINTLIKYHKAGVVTSAALLSVAGLLLFAGQPELAAPVAAAALA